MRNYVTALVLCAAMAPASSVFALSQERHRKISKNFCVDAGLPEKFCERVGIEAYDVDAYEWDDMSAHAQADDGQSLCEGAQAAIVRQRWLGAEMHVALVQQAATPTKKNARMLAQELGRALHTIQDNCTHDGIPNVQHAWSSIHDTCDHTETNPDVQPEAVRCAREETELVFESLLETMESLGVTIDSLRGIPDADTHYPSVGQLCDYLKDAEKWDGVDRSWNRDVMVPRLRSELTTAIATGNVPSDNICDDAQIDLEPDMHPATADTSHPRAFCPKLQILCFGKTDTAAETPVPWTESEDKSELEAESARGCSAAASSSEHRAPMLGTLLSSMAALIVRQRRRNQARS